LTGNIELVYAFFEKNTNMNFECSKNKDAVGTKSIKDKVQGFYNFPKPKNEGGDMLPFST
jgi:hypothetical protein